MKRLILLVLLCSGCINISTAPIALTAFVTQPREMKGYGADTFWLWSDAEALGAALLNAGVNLTGVEVFNCSPSKELSLTPDPSPHGYWTFEKFDGQLAPQLDKFLAAMYARRITVRLILLGGHNLAGVTDDMVVHLCQWLNSRPAGNTGIILCLASEPVASDSHFQHLSAVMEANWQGMKAYNGDVRPNSTPGGYWTEWHSQDGNDIGLQRGNVIVCDDSALWYDLNVDRSLQANLDPAKVAEYGRRVRNAGNGFMSYGQNEGGWRIDVDGIKAIGGLK